MGGHKSLLTKSLFIIGSLLLIISIVFATVKIIDANKSARLNILVAPVDAKILINGKEYKNGNYRFFPGEITVKISRTDMETKEYTRELTADHTTTIMEALNPNDDDEIYKESANFEILKLIQNEDAVKIVNRLNAAARIKDILPLRKVLTLKPGTSSEPYAETVIYNASGNEQCTSYVCLRVKTNVEDKEKAARALIEENGFNIDDYEVIYED